MLRVDIVKQLGEFSLEAAFESQGRVTGLFGASGAPNVRSFDFARAGAASKRVPTKSESQMIKAGSE